MHYDIHLFSAPCCRLSAWERCFIKMNKTVAFTYSLVKWCSREKCACGCWIKKVWMLKRKTADCISCWLWSSPNLSLKAWVCLKLVCVKCWANASEGSRWQDDMNHSNVNIAAEVSNLLTFSSIFISSHLHIFMWNRICEACSAAWDLNQAFQVWLNCWQADVA